MVFRAEAVGFSINGSWPLAQVVAGPTNFPVGLNRYWAGLNASAGFSRLGLTFP